MNTKPIRIAMIMGKYVGGGVEAVVLNYYHYIDKKKIQFDFIFDEDSKNIPYDEIEKLGGKVIICPPYQKVYKYIRFLIKLFKEQKYKVVHSHINTLSVFPLYAAKKAGVKIRIAHSHSTSNSKEVAKNFIKNILKTFSKKYATHFICCSEFAGRWLFGNKLFDEGKVYVLNNAIDLDKFKLDKEARKRVRKELGIDDNTFVLGHIGRFVKQKNHEMLIDIFAELHKIQPDSMLILAGQGPLYDEVNLKVKSLKLEDSVIFLGQRNDANDLYQAFDAFCLPSLYEGLPVVGIEAQTAGLLCYFSDCMTKETKVLNSTVFMSLDDSPEEWASNIIKDNEKFQRVDTRKEITKYGFNIKNEAMKLEQIYFKLMNGSDSK